MNPTLLHLISLSAKIALLGGLAWLQLYLLRRAPAASRSRLCSLSLIAMVLLAGGEWVTPAWLVKTPVFHFTASAGSDVSPAAPRISAGMWIGILWMAGALSMLVRAVVGRIALNRLRSRSTVLEQVSGTDVRMGEVETPILTGLLRPVIIVPPSARQWTVEQRSMVLTHELTHLRRADGWSNLLAQVVRAAFWFHPAVWLLVSRMSREQELTCDEAVVACGHSRFDYAAFLMATVRKLQSREMFACAMAGSGASSLKHRFASLLDAAPRPALTRRVAASIAVFAAVAMMLTAVHPVWSQNQQGKSGPYKVGDGVMQPKVLSKVDPEYTQEDKDARIEGTVILRTVITEEGKAANIEVVRGLTTGLDEKAIEALQQWIFQPGTKDGVAVAVYATVEINFRLK